MLTEVHLSPEALKALEKKKPGKGMLHPTSAHARTRLSVLDSIDGRVLDAGLALIWQPGIGRTGTLVIRSVKTGERLVLLALKTQPQTPNDLPTGLLAGAVRKALGERALVRLHDLELSCSTMDICVKGQTIADALCAAPGKAGTGKAAPGKAGSGKDEPAWMWVDARRGFESQVAAALKSIGKPQDKASVFHSLVERAQHAASLNAKGFPALGKDQPAAKAVQVLHETLLAQMTSQVEGTCNDIDIEFLHDLRVASRRARSLLQTVKTVLADDVQAFGIERFRWVGQQTTALRDLDVYLHDYPTLQSTLSPELQDALEPFRGALIAERKRAFRSVKTMLNAKPFEQFVTSWRKQLGDAKHYTGPDAQKTIGEVAAKAIWKRYQRICADGSAITQDNPAEDLHDLRKQGKKLRYLLEFFASLYAPKLFKPRLASLKKLQDLLGEYQDCAVQAAFLEDKAAKLRKDMSVPAETLMAIGALADQRLRDEKRLRTEFEAFFKPFASARERDRYKTMLKL